MRLAGIGAMTMQQSLKFIRSVPQEQYLLFSLFIPHEVIPIRIVFIEMVPRMIRMLLPSHIV